MTSLRDGVTPRYWSAMSTRAAHRIRWLAVAAAVVVWFIGLALNVGGNAIHLVLVIAMALLVYELLVEDAPA